MKKPFLILACITIAVTLMLPTVKAAQPAEGFDPEDQMYLKAENEYYWKGRYSNGRVFAEYIAKELANDYDNLTNYAVGGAFSGVMTGEKDSDSERTNWSTWLQGWGGIQQTEKFLDDVNGEADPNALYIISVGGNDAYAVEDLGVERAAELSSDFSLQMIKNLVVNGAKYILLPNRFIDNRSNLTSFEDLRNQQVSQKIKAYLDLEDTPNDIEIIFGHNQRLLENIEEQGFEKFDYKSMGFYLISDWAPAYGYAFVADDNSNIFPTTDKENTLDGYNIYSTDSKYYQPETKGWEPDDFFTYDEYHASHRTQKHLATYLLNSDITTEDGVFKKIYNGEVSDFAKLIDTEIIPAEYSTVYTFGDSSIDTGRGLAVTAELLKNRENSSTSNSPEASTYTVKPGDNLWTIAEKQFGNNLSRHQIQLLTQSIYDANIEQIKNPNLIFPNQVIVLPAS